MKICQSTLLCLLLSPLVCLSQTRAGKPAAKTVLARPKLVVGIVVDQMRWDYLYRYYDRYQENGFKRLLNQGFSCENTFINYIPSVTAVGHATIFTGSVPAIHGIAGNGWINQLTGKNVYCTDDSTVTSVGTSSPEGKMSPRNMLATTITDELRLATNYKAKVIGVSLKDRASILPAGHLGHAYWLDDASGNFITSTYYMNELPDWVKAFNNRKRINALTLNKWEPLYPANTYLQSDTGDLQWKNVLEGSPVAQFPYDLQKAYAARKSSFRQTPFGNTFTMEFASAAILANDLGKDSITDFLTINFASTDYVGHMVGPNAIEVEDTYLRLDRDLATLLTLLDSAVGKEQYLVFLSADHGAAHNIAYMQHHHLPADSWHERALTDSLNALLEKTYGIKKPVRSMMNYQVNFDYDRLTASPEQYENIKKTAVYFLKKQPGISFAVDIENIGQAPVPEPLKTMIINGYNFKRSGAIQIILNPAWFESGSKKGTTHGSWNPYDTHIPLLWYGWGIKKGSTNRETYMTDIAATLAALLHIQMPNGCIGKVIEALVQ